MQLHQQVERLMLQNHDAGDVVGERDLATQLVGDGAVGEGLVGEQAGAEQRQAQQSGGF